MFQNEIWPQIKSASRFLAAWECFYQVSRKQEFSQICSLQQKLKHQYYFHFTAIPVKSDDLILLKSPQTMFFNHLLS